MYSVEDLLISHGYRPPRGTKADGQPQARTRPRGSQGLQNGCEDGAAAQAPSRPAPGPGPVRAPEGRRGAPGGRAGHRGTSASGAAEAGFRDQPASARPSQPQPGNDQACRRRGQNASGSAGLRARGEREGRAMAQARSLPVHTREGPWDVGGRPEHVTKKAVWEEAPRTAGPAKRQDGTLESWDPPRKLGRQMSDGDSEKLFQDLYPFVQGEHALTSQNRRKSQSLPRVLSPEDVSYMEIPLARDTGRFPGVPGAPPGPPNCAPPPQSARSSGKPGSSAPFPRPKFGRPVKPPSYSSHPRPRAGERGTPQDGQQTEPRGPRLAKTSDRRQEPSVPDCGLEPPVYVPPPSYRSPPLLIPNPYLEDTVPRHVRGSHGPQLPPSAKPGAGGPLPPGPLRAGQECGASPGPPRSLRPHPLPAAAPEGSVQYIPFDDPRIRHIGLAQPLPLGEETKPDNAPELARGERPQDGADLSGRSLAPTPGAERGLASADLGPRWLRGQLPGDRDDASFPDQGERCGTRGQQARGEGGRAGARASPPDPQARGGTREARTELRMFESGVQTGKSSKKKTNETLFCLVSIPVKSESGPPEIDGDDSDLKQRAGQRPGLGRGPALREQSLLGMSATDLELQALTGSMAGETEFPTQEPGEPEGDRRTEGLGRAHLAGHRALRPAGSWPGLQYRDQQTQTSFPEEPKTPQPLRGAELGELSGAAPPPERPEPPASGPREHAAAPGASDPGQKGRAPSLQGQAPLSPSGRSAFSRTSPSTHQPPLPKGGQSQPRVDARGQGASPGPTPEVVKGEPTAGPCNSKQLFGQFLLKPVSRRPWDLISQLESFNKELQEEEDSPDGSSGGSSEENETEAWREGSAGSGPRAWGFGEASQEKRDEQQPGGLVLQDPGCWSGGLRSGPESWSEVLEARPPSPGFSQVGDGRDEPFGSAGAGLVAETWKQEIVNGMDRLAVSADPGGRVTASRPGDLQPGAPSWPADPREPAERERLTGAFSCVQRSRELPPGVDGAEQRAGGAPLTLTNKSRGLSVPDLRSIGLMMRPEPSACKLDRPLGEGSAGEMPPSPSESLQERAARILGIEVAMEALLPGSRTAGPSQPPEPGARACSPEPPTEASLPSSAPLGAPAVTADAFYGRRRCGWTQSPLFVGDRAPPVPECSAVGEARASHAASPEPSLQHLEPRSPEQRDEGPKPPFRSTLFHVIERTPSVAGSEKRLRSPSKVIESLQEKLASPQRTAAPDRLLRMKEVSSVSRMRSLSVRGSDSAEETAGLQASGGRAWQPGAPVSLSRGDQAWREGRPPRLPRGIGTWEENGPVAAQSGRSAAQDFWCPDSYDPSRVERV